MTQKLIFLLFFGFLTTTAAAGPDAIVVVCYPGGPVNAKDANGALGSMLRVAERVGQWPENSFISLFTSKAEECRQLMAEKKPKFAITSLGLFLELRDQHHLIPVVQPRIKGKTTERYRVIASKDKYKNLDDLKGKTLAGTVLEEPAFIGRIVFAGKFEPASFFDLKPSSQAIRALRSLDKGELDAVILNEQQFAGLDSLKLENAVDAVFTSEEIPLMGLVANGESSTDEERSRFTKALSGMCADVEGKKLCDLFGVESFAAVDPSVFEPMIKLWGEGK